MSPASAAERIDWSQLWCPGPRRRFSAEELARAGGQAPSRTLIVASLFNAALLGFGLLQFAPAGYVGRLSALMLAAVVSAAIGARALWRRPSRQLLFRASMAYALGALAFGAAIAWRTPVPAEQLWVFGVCWGAALIVSTGLWVLTVVRAEQIEARLRELDERERRADMARQLAQAQIQPHFLFNSLASLQHWVQTKDDRAAPMLEALSGFLRATLPLFDRRRLGVAEEMQAVRQYLAVMALRLGARLRYEVDVTSKAAAAQLPPGLLLTLVENAIEHGVQKSLSGADVRVSATAQGTRLVVEVRDSGPGITRDATDGVGLGNARARLAQAFGADAALQLLDAAPGCLARIEAPLGFEPTPHP